MQIKSWIPSEGEMNKWIKEFETKLEINPNFKKTVRQIIYDMALLAFDYKIEFIDGIKKYFDIRNSHEKRDEYWEFYFRLMMLSNCIKNVPIWQWEWPEEEKSEKGNS
jgi:hypothetical protein